MEPEVEPEVSVNRKTLRELLVKSFSYEELKDLCFDHYPVVYDNLGNGFGKSVIARLLIDYCQRQGLVKALLAQIEARNPYQYSIYKEALFEPAPASVSADQERKVTLKLVFPNIKIEDFTPDKQAALIQLMAEELDIPEESIAILEIRQGSVIIRLSLPVAAVSRLLALYQAGHPVIEDLGLGRIEGVPLKLLVRDRIVRLLTRLSNQFNLPFMALTGFLLLGGLAALILSGPVTHNRSTVPPERGAAKISELIFVTATGASVSSQLAVPSTTAPSINAVDSAPGLNAPGPGSTGPAPTATAANIAIAATGILSPTQIPKATATGPQLAPTPTPGRATTTPPAATPTQTASPRPANQPTGDTTTLESTPAPGSPRVVVAGPAQIKAGQRFTVAVNIEIDGPPGVFGAQFRLNYDPARVQVAGIRSNPELLVAVRSFDNKRGRVEFAASRREDVANFTKEVTFALVTFKAQPAAQAGATAIDPSHVKLGAKGGIAVPASSQALALTITQ